MATPVATSPRPSAPAGRIDAPVRGSVSGSASADGLELLTGWATDDGSGSAETVSDGVTLGGVEDSDGAEDEDGAGD